MNNILKAWLDLLFSVMVYIFSISGPVLLFIVELLRFKDDKQSILSTCIGLVAYIVIIVCVSIVMIRGFMSYSKDKKND